MLDKHSAVPLYVQLKGMLERQLANGTLPPHSRVPSERELSELYTISRMTARQALAELIQDGRLYTSTGKGTFVAEPKIQQNLQALTSFTEDMQTRGLSSATRLLRREFVAAPQIVAERLRLPEGTPVAAIERLRLADNEPMAVESAFLLFDGVQRLLELNLDQSLYAVLQQEFGIVPSEAVQDFEALHGQPRERQLLRLPESAAMLKVQRTTFDQHGQPFECVQSFYRGDRYRFTARLVRGDL